MRSIIGLLTDFGLADHYVGVVKAVIAGIAPEALVIDISHAVPPQSVLSGQRLLRASVPYFPPQSVFLAVIDPGVGTSRRPMALRSAGHTFVGPDNGLFTPWLPGESSIELTSPEYRLAETSATFHGRDVFAPAAAHLALGVGLERFGPLLLDPVQLLPPFAATLQDGTIQGEIAYVDYFGNLITNIAGGRGGVVLWRGKELPVRPTYGAAEPGELLALTGSQGDLELAVRDGSAARELGVRAGEPVSWRPV
ncbi:MAG TPA: SAM-dependent chlorinase/fluorinase [Chloroflexota bacterium]